ncbi:ABC transporter ATP-binding protein [Streptococcus pluranimalium]|uniref:Fluoroquinolones export ATP-binding protein n=1 Tax=Streptococcus pluranimalium TaxID=82348 RepID=A0A345VMN3_9STRE|nr:ABC transporter ATP-binding protein [Streptococcus pluranimalium]AXJ13985.1 Fluoroquinolones export ATP-binding protein [Streptococcus pluranimalium]
MSKQIEVKQLSKSFKGSSALNNISFSVDKGQIFGFLGPSGAGKTTTINILTGQLRPDSGGATIFGKDVSSLTKHDFKRIGIMSDVVGFYEKMTVEDNLLFFAKFHKVSKEMVYDYLKKLDLYDSRHKKAESLSVGMKQRLFLIRAILHNPEVVFLDEPTSGMDPGLAEKVHHLLFDLKSRGTTIFLTTHNMSEASKVCDYITILHKGRIVENGNPSDIIARHSKQDAIELTYASGKKIIVAKSNVKDYLDHDIVSMHTYETSLETIFIKLTEENHG